MGAELEEVLIDLNGSHFEVLCQIKRSSRARRITLRVESKEKVTLTLPNWASIQQGYDFLHQQEEWLVKRIEKLPSMVSLTHYFSDQGRVWLTPGARKLSWSITAKGTKSTYEISFDDIKFNIINRGNTIDEEIFLLLFQLAKDNLAERLYANCERVGVDVRKVRVGDQKSRWGSCSSKGTISLNWRLVLLPYSIGEYVIFHELAHLRHLDHSIRFWNYLESICSDSKSKDKELRILGKQIMQMGRF
jgi:predicted metal-dependent hydrolase